MTDNSDLNDKTEALRDIFMERSEAETVTQTQTDDRGSLTGDEQAADEHIRRVIDEMRDRYEFRTDLDDSVLTDIVHGFYADRSDAQLSDELGLAAETVFRARLDLHLLRESDTDAPIALAELGDLLDEGLSVEDCAERLGVDPATVDRYKAVLSTRRAISSVSRRFRSEFEDALPAVSISDSLTDEIREDGLDDATEGMETDVSL